MSPTPALLRPETTSETAGTTDYIAEAITEAYGERCPDFVEGCACCEAWKQYDALKAAAQVDVEAIAMNEWHVGYLTGFLASGEGWNGEYPFGNSRKIPQGSLQWVAARDREYALRAPILRAALNTQLVSPSSSQGAHDPAPAMDGFPAGAGPISEAKP